MHVYISMHTRVPDGGMSWGLGLHALLLPSLAHQEVVELDLNAQGERQRLVEGEAGPGHQDVLAWVGQHRQGELDGLAAATGQDDVLHTAQQAAVSTGAAPRATTSCPGPVPAAEPERYVVVDERPVNSQSDHRGATTGCWGLVPSPASWGEGSPGSLQRLGPGFLSHPPQLQLWLPVAHPPGAPHPLLGSPGLSEVLLGSCRRQQRPPGTTGTLGREGQLWREWAQTLAEVQVAMGTWQRRAAGTQRESPVPQARSWKGPRTSPA